MSTTQRDVAQFLAELNQRLAVLEADQARLEEREHAIEAREATIEKSSERKYAAKLAELERKAAELAAQFEQRAQETIEELSQKARVKIAKTRREYQESVAELAPAVNSSAKRDAPPRLRLEVGARVRLKGIRQPATVRRLLADGSVEVDAGFMKMQVPESDVEEILPAASAVAKPSGIRVREGPSFDGSYKEINLIGQRAEEACNLVDKFLDTAALAQVDRVRIVHGHGMGILKRAIAELLAENPHVAKFYLAPPEAGGAGATIVELK
jgi:DNA mismatch repair protein MutS2